VNVLDDLKAAVDEAVDQGRLSEEQGEGAMALLSGRIESATRRGWFGKGNVYYNEQSLIDTDGRLYRPDRVVRRPDGSVLVIDYKFGEESPFHVRQVSEYVSLFRKMGYPCVSGYIWYVRSDKVISV